MPQRLKAIRATYLIGLAAILTLAIALALALPALSMDGDYGVESGASAAGKVSKTPAPPNDCVACVPIPGQPVQTNTPVPPTATPPPTNTPAPTSTSAPASTPVQPATATKEVRG